MVRSVLMAGLLAMCAPLVAGCTIDSGGDKYREPLPEQGSVALRLPGSSSSAGASGTRTLDTNGGSSGAGAQSDAEFYTFSREVTDAMDTTTAAVVGLVWLIAQEEPTTVEDKRAVWGPYQGSALERASWRLVVKENAAGEYDYSLEGRARGSSSEGDWKPVLTGRGYGKDHALHKSGNFAFDNEAYRALEPTKAKDSGKCSVTYDVRKVPQTISVELRPSDGTGSIDAKVEHRAGGAGLLTLSGKADIEEEGEKDGKLEDVAIKSQWNAQGAGRAEIQISGGSLPSSIPQVEAVECWSTNFSRAYYTDSAGIEQTAGAETACPSF